MKDIVYYLLMFGFVFAYDSSVSDPNVRRIAVTALSLEKTEALETLAKALADEHPVVRRTAIRSLVSLGKPALRIIENAFENDDGEVRAASLKALFVLGTGTKAHIEAALADKHPSVRRAAVQILLDRKPYKEGTQALLERVSQDEMASIRNLVGNAVWPFFKPTELLKHRVVDLVIETTQSLPLPLDGWKLKPDSAMTGHKQKWFLPEHNDNGWNSVSIGKFWGDFGTNYIGHVWYRGRFVLPVKPKAYDAIEIEFTAVDESAWVWINGEYAGQHDIGPEGWNEVFQLDVTSLLKWGTENQITVRVLNAAYAGGIHKPVHINVLKVKN